MFANLLNALLAPSPAPLSVHDAKLALAGLMVRIARTDNLYAIEEVERIEKVLMQRYDLDAFGAANLRAQAETLESMAPDTIRFTRALKDAVPLQDRSDLMVALWSVALSDGERNADEDQMMRLICNLLGLTDVDSALARQHAAALLR